MNNDFDLIRSLHDEWGRVGASPPYRAALAGWVEREPVLTGFASPAEVVAWCWCWRPDWMNTSWHECSGLVRRGWLVLV